jgi:flagellar hook protein FlgE
MGSLFAALTTAVSGLNAQSSSIGNISENLANAQTTGFKSVETSFEQLVNSSNATVNNPGGVLAKPRYQNDVQGSITSSNTSTSLAISGQGYFAVQTASTDALGTTTFNEQQFYTRQGDFTLDKNGFLVNSSGFYLDGYAINADGTVNTSTTAPVQISALLNDPVAASKIDYSANLPSNAAVGYTSPASTLLVFDALGNQHAVNYTWTKTSTNNWSLNVSAPDGIDVNGSPYSATIPYTFNDGSSGSTAGTIGAIATYTAPTAPTFRVSSAPPITGNFTIGNVSIPWSSIVAGSVSSVTVSGASTTLAAGPAAGPHVPATTAIEVADNFRAIFNILKSDSTLSGENLASITASNAPTTADIRLTTTNLTITPTSGTAANFTWADSAGGTTAETIAGSPYTAPTGQGAAQLANVGISLTFPGSTAQPISLNFGTFNGSIGVTQFADTNGTVAVSNFSQNGLPQGSFNSVSIDNNGNVSLNFSNGTNKAIAQIPVAQFFAQNSLQKVTGGAYTATLASGNARLSAPGVNGSGTISSNSLEQSNVDISTQFTNLIQAQQVYSANAKVVTTDNSLLQVTLNMIQ